MEERDSVFGVEKLIISKESPGVVGMITGVWDSLHKIHILNSTS